MKNPIYTFSRENGWISTRVNSLAALQFWLHRLECWPRVEELMDICHHRHSGVLSALIFGRMIIPNDLMGLMIGYIIDLDLSPRELLSGDGVIIFPNGEEQEAALIATLVTLAAKMDHDNQSNQ